MFLLNRKQFSIVLGLVNVSEEEFHLSGCKILIVQGINQNAPFHHGLLCYIIDDLT